MSGLVRNYYYSARASARWFLAIVVVTGVAIVLVGKSAFLIPHAVLCMLGFSFNSMASFQKENYGKWNQYKIVAPLRRKTIMKSRYVCQFLWLMAGVLIAYFFIALTLLFHGNVFEVQRDIVSIFVLGFSIGLLMGSLYNPLALLGGEERHELMLGLSVVGAIGIFGGLTYAANYAYSFRMDMWAFYASMAIVVGATLLLYLASYLISARVFCKKEC